MQSKVDKAGKNPPKAFTFPVNPILLTFITGLLFITLASATPHLQNSTGPVESGNLTTSLDEFQEQLTMLAQSIHLLKVDHVDQLSAVAADINGMLTSCVGELDDKKARLGKPGLCLPKWRKHGNSCFLFVSDRKTWYDAKKHCSADGGHLASVQDQAMYDFFEELAEKTRIWVGGYKGLDENGDWTGEWKWVDGSKFEVKKYEDKSAKDAAWAQNEPNNYQNEDCVEIRFNYNGLNDLACASEQEFICQK